MRLGDLVRTSEFELSIVVGGSEALERSVTGAFITDLPDPSPFLEPGYIVLSSGLWVDRPGAMERFISALVDNKVAALFLGVVELGFVPDRVISVCRDHGIVLAMVSDNVSFGTIADAVRDGQGQSSSSILRNAFIDGVLDASADRGPSAGVADLSARAGVPFWIGTPSGRILGGSKRPSPERATAVWAAAPEGDMRGPQRLALHPPATAWSLGASEQGHIGLLVAEADLDSLPAEVIRAAGLLVPPLGAERRFESSLLSEHHAQAASLVTAALDDSVPPGEISALMRLVGLDPQYSTRVLAAVIDDDSCPSQLVLEVLERLVEDVADCVVSCILDGTAIVVVSEREPNTARLSEVLTRRAEADHPLVGARHIVVVASEPVSSVSNLGSAVRFALDRVHSAQGGVAPVTVLAGSSTDSHRTLLRMLSPQSRAEFATRVLAPLLDYDTRHGGDLLGTVSAFLKSDGAWQDAARALHIHPNTLRYRVARVEELTKRDLSSIEDRTDLFVALECLRG